ncbi:MAG: glucose-6-phosphate dehydrogenase [Candidatus Rokubacteria bacterium]|nr:glucose-6-phosphate dehydrogenase [Candidatus Rokubacteria bacterium]MBI3826196.1 glucose-6-phosphate dehydrogenase [Candidatus Rokubacteria bacterium]
MLSPVTLNRSAVSPAPTGQACVMVIFGASGDLTKRLLMPALYNLACDGLLSERFALVGVAMDELTTGQFREKMSTDVRQFSTRQQFDEEVWSDLVRRFWYAHGTFEETKTFERVVALVEQLDGEWQSAGNVLYYLAVPPPLFGLISAQLASAGGTAEERGWRRVIVEKPFGHDLASAIELSGELLKCWREDQIYRIDHYLGKETVQNLLAFRFSNGMFEPLWNRNHVDHIQLTVAETVGVEGRGRYYERAGVLRDMIQNHMLQMLAYLCMEPPPSLRPEAIRNEKAKVLEAVRTMRPEDVLANAVRGQYAPGRRANGETAVGYRQESDVDPRSSTETFAALRLFIDNWRWEGVPIYLRSGKALWRRGTEILVQFKKAPEVIFRDTPTVERLESNQLIFHIQPDQEIEVRFQAKHPGPSMNLQQVNMRFDYREAFEAARATGYEVLLYHCMLGDAMLFSRTDLVKLAWRIAQPILDVWTAMPAEDFPNYPAGSWGPKAAFDLIERDGRTWLEVVNRNVVEQVPLFQACSAIFQRNIALALKPGVCAPGDFIVRKGDVGREMYFLVKGEVDVLDGDGAVINALGPGAFFGEISLLRSEPRNASVRAREYCEVFVLEKEDFNRVLRDHPEFAKTILQACQTRYNVSVAAEHAFERQVSVLME